NHSVTATLVRGPGGRWRLAFSAVPDAVQSVRILRADLDYYYELVTWFDDPEEIPVGAISGGYYEIPDAEAVEHRSDLVYVQGIGANGELGDLVMAGIIGNDAPYFVDGQA